MILLSDIVVFMPLCLDTIVIYAWIPLLVVDQKDTSKVTDETRSLGLVVCRGTAVVLICPADAMEQIANPFLQGDTV